MSLLLQLVSLYTIHFLQLFQFRILRQKIIIKRQNFVRQVLLRKEVVLHRVLHHLDGLSSLGSHLPTVSILREVCICYRIKVIEHNRGSIRLSTRKCSILALERGIQVALFKHCHSS